MQADYIARGMPLNNKKTMWFTNLSTSFAKLAVEGCASKEVYTIMDNHIKQIRFEVDEIKKRRKNNTRRERKCQESISKALNSLLAGPNASENASLLAHIPIGKK